MRRNTEVVPGFLYLGAIIEWYSRYVISWRLSNTLSADFCVEALEDALSQCTPEIFNIDQGSQFTGEAFTGLLANHNVRISMDGKGSNNDSLFIERSWHTVKYEEVYLKLYMDGREARNHLEDYCRLYNTTRPHQALGYKFPAEVYAREVITRGMVKSRSAESVFHLNLAPILSR